MTTPPGASSEVRIIAVRSLPEVHPGDNLSALINEALEREGTQLQHGDVVAVTQKVVSKAEGRLVDLNTVTPSTFACQVAEQYGKDARMVEVVLRESKRFVRMDHGVLVVETHHGFVCANAGVDRSNVPGGDYVSLLPQDPDASAARVRSGLQARWGVSCAVIITDSFGRPWREGITEVAIGVAGMAALRSYHGVADPYGYVLNATDVAVADYLATAAGLVMEKLSKVAAAIVRGYPYPPGEGSAQDLLRAPERDMFR